MKKIVFVTNLPSPYRVSFFNELGKKCFLTVIFERHSSSERDAKWVGESFQFFNAVFPKLEPIGADQSRGNGISKCLKNLSFDILIISNYGSPAIWSAISYCKIHHIPFFVEHDGGFNRRDNPLKRVFKQFLLKKSIAHLTTSEEHIEYLNGLGIKKESIIKYPFSSIKNKDILQSPVSFDEKRSIRKKLGITEKKVILSVGQIIHRKGFDILIKAMDNLDDSFGLYIVGGKPTEEFLKCCGKVDFNRIHFVEFNDAEHLKEWYKSADIFVLPTREDIWGLVINEALAHCLPVVTSNTCLAGIEMIVESVNGSIIHGESPKDYSDAIQSIISSPHYIEYCINSGKKASEYTIETMVESHIVFFGL